MLYTTKQELLTARRPEHKLTVFEPQISRFCEIHVAILCHKVPTRIDEDSRAEIGHHVVKSQHNALSLHQHPRP